MKSQKAPVLSEEKSGRALLGFRSNRLWKKIVSGVYLVFLGFFLLGSVFVGKYKNITTYDHFINIMSNLLCFVIFATPYIFLSNTKYRKKLPLFKNYRASSSALGLTIVNIMLLILLGGCDIFHSQEYKADMANHDYVILEETKADCEKEGRIEYLCDYCGKTNTETISALGHDMKETSATEAICEKDGLLVEKCTRCGRIEETKSSALGHDMQESSKTEATCGKDGLLVEKCVRCDETKETKLSALGHDMKETSATEATCEKDGLVIEKCTRCGEIKETKSSALGHDMQETSRTEATEYKDGEVVRQCSRCENEDIEIIGKWGKTEEEYKAECGIVSYENVARFPDDYVGYDLMFEGKVVQVTENGNYLILRMAVETDEYGNYYSDTIIWVEYIRNNNEARILEDDILTVYGAFKGIKTYESVLGASISVPYLVAEYID